MSAHAWSFGRPIRSSYDPTMANAASTTANESPTKSTASVSPACSRSESARMSEEKLYDTTVSSTREVRSFPVLGCRRSRRDCAPTSVRTCCQSMRLTGRRLKRLRD